MNRVVVSLCALALSVATGFAAGQIVPNFTGLPEGTATKRARDDGFTVSRAWFVSPKPALTVVAQMPGPGIDRLMPDGSSLDHVHFYVSTGLRATGRPAAEFRTTGGAIYCQVNTATELSYSLNCWRPRDGVMAALFTEFPENPFYRSGRLGARGKKPSGFRTIGYGGTWRRFGMRCVSRPVGLTCRARTGDGMFIGTVRGTRQL